MAAYGAVYIAGLNAIMKSMVDYATPVSGLVSALLLALVLPRAQERVEPSGPAFTVPPGFEVARVAGPPLVDRPIVADFDDEGRLYVADSSGSNDRVEKQLADRPHRIMRLEDTNGDGRFDVSVVFADKMMLPEGTMWLDGSLYVAAPPSIWKLTDTDEDGVADRREEWYTGETLTGCANDLHGPYLGPDGWIYWTKGAFAQQTRERLGRPPLVTRAAHILRRRPGGGPIEVVMTGGMDNPVDVAFTPSGERILSATFLEHPQAGRRDALVHAIYGGVYGKPHNVLDGHSRTGDLMPVMCQLGPAVPAGLTRYESRVFGVDYRDTFFAAMFNLRKVTRHVLVPDGATFTTRDSDFLVSDNRDFHPTDVVEDADGSLLVIDTGPWYKLCCPTSQLAKPEVLGAIYRVRRTGAPIPSDPRGRRLAWDSMTPAQLTTRLDDARPAVQRRALRQFAKVGATAVPALAGVVGSSRSVEARRNAVWALTRIESAGAREVVRAALVDRDVSVRHAAILSSGLWRDLAALPGLTGALTSGAPAIQRAAAEALGRVGDARAVPDLLAASASPADRVLEHSLTYALIEIGNAGATAAGLKASASRATRAALIALDQIDGGHVTPEGLIPLFGSSDPVMRQTAWWIAERHPEWGGALASSFEARLTDPDLSGTERDEFVQRLARFGGDAAIQALLARTVAVGPSPGARLTGLRAMSAAASSSIPAAIRVKELPAVWSEAVSHALATADDDVTRQAVLIVRSVPAGRDAVVRLQDALLRVARNTARPVDVRIDALTARTPRSPIDADLFELLRSSLEPARPALLRAAAATVIEKARLDRLQLFALVQSLETAAPLELPHLLPAFDTAAGDEELGLAMLAALNRSSTRSTLRAEDLRPRLAMFPDSVRRAGEALLVSVNVGAAKQAEDLEGLLGTVQGGDVARGQTIFNGSKGACLSCHAIGYIGGRIGPDLTRVGQIRSERDLLEAVVFPNASFARGFEPMRVRTRAGQVHAGVLRSDAPDEVVLSAVSGPDMRIRRQDIAEIEPGTVSLMPPGYADLLTRQELADLIAFLKAAR